MILIAYITIVSMIEISSDFDSGNGDFDRLEESSKVFVAIRNDSFTELEKVHFKQWFHFRVGNVKNKSSAIQLLVMRQSQHLNYPFELASRETF